MNEILHALLAGTILMFLWMVWGKKLMRSPKDEYSWEEWKRIFFQ